MPRDERDLSINSRVMDHFSEMSGLSGLVLEQQNALVSYMLAFTRYTSGERPYGEKGVEEVLKYYDVAIERGVPARLIKGVELLAQHEILRQIQGKLTEFSPIGG